MKKHYALLASALFLSVAGFSQDRTMPDEAEGRLFSIEHTPTKSKVITPKSYGDTIAYFDFNGSMPAGWTFYENAGIGFNWQWSTEAPGGAFTSAPPINSTTGTNGFMLMRSDSFNTPPINPLDLDAYFESAPIPIDSAVKSVLLRWQQSFRYCCNGAVVMDLEVKSNIHPQWDTISVKFGVPVNAASADPMFAEINISEAAANADTITFRFHYAASSHYYWMIDDIAVVEGPAYDLVLDDFGVNYESFGSPFRQFYEQVPFDFFDTMFVSSTVLNNGGNVDSGTVAYEITHDLNCMGMPGYGSYSYVHEDLPAMNPLTGVDINFNDPFLPPAKGQYTISAFVQSAHADQVGDNNLLSNTFIVGDTIYAKDDGTAENTAGPHNWVGFDHNGARLLLYYEMPEPAVATSLSYYVAGSRSVGASFTAELWGIDTTRPNCNLQEQSWTSANLHTCISSAPVAFNPFSVNVTAGMINTWVTVPITPTLLNQYSGYLVGFQANGYQFDNDGNVTTGMSVGDDLDGMDQGAFNGQGFYDYNAIIGNDDMDDLGIAGANPMMRINFGQLSDTCFLVGIDETQINTEFSIYPNPNNGQFNLKISSNMSKDYNLTITNMLGQNVYSEEISLNNEVLNKSMDFSQLEKGIYFVTLKNATERKTQKIVIR